MPVPLIILGTILENLYFYLGVVSIKPLNGKIKNLFLFVGIIAINYISIRFYLNIYRYIFSIALFYLLLFALYTKSTHIYDIFMISFYMLSKLIIEFTYFVIILRNKINDSNIFACFIVLIIFQIILKDLHVKLYKLIIHGWRSRHRFYVKYGSLVLLNGLILFIIYNIIRIKELI